jgi:hypothetical protein
MEDQKRFFARERVPVMKHNVAMHANDLYDWTRLLDSAKQGNKHLKNTEHCFDYMRPCKYLGICSGRSEMDDLTQWRTEKNPHAELDLPEGVDPGKVITNSRMKVFKGCPYKHHLQYNLGLRKVRETEDEPLVVGSCGHVALEEYFKAIGRQQGKSL